MAEKKFDQIILRRDIEEQLKKARAQLGSCIREMVDEKEIRPEMTVQELISYLIPNNN